MQTRLCGVPSISVTLSLPKTGYEYHEWADFRILSYRLSTSGMKTLGLFSSSQLILKGLVSFHISVEKQGGVHASLFCNYTSFITCVFECNNIKGKAVSVVNYVPRHEDVWGSGGTAPCILNPTLNGGKWSVSRPGLCPKGNSPRCPLDKRLGGPQSQSGRGGEQKEMPSLQLPEIVQFVVRSLY